VYLTPTEEERLRVFAAAELARRHRERGLRLNAPEAAAIIADEMHLAARAGGSFDDVITAGMRAVRDEELMDGVASIVDEVRVEVLLADGSRLVVVRPAWATGGDGPGAVRVADRGVELAPGLERRRLTVTNRSNRPVRLSSHYPFAGANPRLEFDREAAEGFRLDVPAGDSVRWGPGETREVDLVAYGGRSQAEAPAE
jgi:urease subunit gamma/beta